MGVDIPIYKEALNNDETGGIEMNLEEKYIKDAERVDGVEQDVSFISANVQALTKAYNQGLRDMAALMSGTQDQRESAAKVTL
jgi:hypothetical protein